MTNKELAEWILRFPEEDMTYHCVAINGCGAVAVASTGTDDEMKDALAYGALVL